tara:strand:- start:2859 stop:3719 length:861 start_codon:yes stop_codon:yes gene_type:complete
MSAIKNLINILNLSPVGDNQFESSVKEIGWRRVFGGLLLAQGILAAYKTVENKKIHSLHSYFVKAGDPDIPIQYKVTSIHDGKSFCQRNISSYQKNHLIFYMVVSFHKYEEGLSHQEEMPKNIISHDELKNELELLNNINELPDTIRDTRLRERPIEYRPTKPRNIMSPKKEKPIQNVWLKTSEKIDLTEPLQYAMLAYASDYTILDTALMPHGISIFEKKLQIASLDHSMWFYRSFDINDWLIYCQKSPNASNSRGFSTGNIFSKNGKLIASVAQEGMIRNMPNI